MTERSGRCAAANPLHGLPARQPVSSPELRPRRLWVECRNA